MLPVAVVIVNFRMADLASRSGLAVARERSIPDGSPQAGSYRRFPGLGTKIERVPQSEVVHHVRGGGEPADAPSPHFVRSARRYLVQRGHSRRLWTVLRSG